jgi:hypothetical protein
MILMLVSTIRMSLVAKDLSIAHGNFCQLVLRCLLMPEIVMLELFKVFPDMIMFTQQTRNEHSASMINLRHGMMQDRIA